MELIKTVGLIVKQLRENRKLNVDECAKLASISRPYLQKIESGTANLSLEVLISLAAVLNVEPSDLLKVDSSTDEEGLLLQQIAMLGKSKSVRDLRCVIALLNAME